MANTARRLDLRSSAGDLSAGTALSSKPEHARAGEALALQARRAQSFSDFFHVAQTQAKKDGKKSRERSLAKVKNELDFQDWYKGIEEELLDASLEEYRLYLDQLDTTKAHLDSLLSNTSDNLLLLSELSASFKSVDTQTSAFREQCQGLISAQKQSTRLSDDINENLRYYDYLEPITRRLNAPGAGSTVRSKDFSDMLRNLDESIDYMESHPAQKEAETYRSRYRLLLTRALTLIRVHFTGAVREIASGVTKRIADRQLNDTTMSALLYAKFRVGAAELKDLGLEIQKRAVVPAGAEPGSEAEYSSLMNELHTSFSATRAKLVIPLVRKKLADIAQAPSTSKDLVAFARNSISYVRGICLDEFELWGEWFHGRAGLYDFLESVCEPLYDHLRPRIIHEMKLLKLCQLCTLLQTRYLHDPDDELEAVDPNQLDFSVLIQPALEDAQSRLVFRAQAMLRDEIENFKPKPEDLDYPGRNKKVSLSGTKSQTPVTSGRKVSAQESTTPIPKNPVIVDQDEDSPDAKGSRWDFDRQAAFEGWYPTLPKAIWLLSRIYRLINSAVFDDLAHQIVHQTTTSLHTAATLISTKSTPTDSQLFLIKHLLILKQQIVAFDIEFVATIPDVSFDFSGMTQTFYELRERGGLFNPRNLMRLVGGSLFPRVVENMLDAKVELDGRLRTVINDFTNTFAKRMTNSLPVTPPVDKKPLPDASRAVLSTRKAVEQSVPFLRQKLDEYLSDQRTRETLVGAVQDQVIQIYEDFFDVYTSKENNKGKTISKKGKGREDAVWDVDTFAEWTEGIFGVHGIERDGNGEESQSRSLSRSGSPI